MTTAYAAVDAFLTANYRLGLEDVLCDGCLMGRLDIALAEIAKIIPRRIRSEPEEDGGEYATYEGVLILDGIWYRFGCHIFLDAGGLCFLADVTEFEVVEWKVRLAVSR